jgi:hypothetical protein
MLALIYVFTIWCVASLLLVVVNRFEPNRRVASVLKFLVLVVSAAACKTADALTSVGWRALRRLWLD